MRAATIQVGSYSYQREYASRTIHGGIHKTITVTHHVPTFKVAMIRGRHAINPASRGEYLRFGRSRATV